MKIQPRYIRADLKRKALSSLVVLVLGAPLCLGLYAGLKTSESYAYTDCHTKVPAIRHHYRKLLGQTDEYHQAASDVSVLVNSDDQAPEAPCEDKDTRHTLRLSWL
jgi:hypothetical protein